MPIYTKPIIELAAENVAAVLATITQVNGFHVNLGPIERQTRVGNIPDDEKVYLIQDVPRPVDSPALGHEEWYVPFAVWIFTIDPDASKLPIDARMNMSHADVQKALVADYTRGGYAIDTLFKSPGYIQDDAQQIVGIIANFEVYLRTIYGDPYSQ